MEGLLALYPTAGLYFATAIGAVYSATVTSQPRRVDGFQATSDYERANGLLTRSPARDRAEWQLAMGPDYWRNGRGWVGRR